MIGGGTDEQLFPNDSDYIDVARTWDVGDYCMVVTSGAVSTAVIDTSREDNFGRGYFLRWGYTNDCQIVYDQTQLQGTIHRLQNLPQTGLIADNAVTFPIYDYKIEFPLPEGSGTTDVATAFNNVKGGPIGAWALGRESDGDIFYMKFDTNPVPDELPTGDAEATTVDIDNVGNGISCTVRYAAFHKVLVVKFSEQLNFNVGNTSIAVYYPQ